MTFKEQLEADAAVFFNLGEFASEVLYNDAAITAVFVSGADLQGGNVVQSEGQSARARLWVMVSDVPEPKNLDRVVADGVTWRVAKKAKSTDVWHCLELVAKGSVF